jgi:YHS domain-containing protein
MTCPLDNLLVRLPGSTAWQFGLIGLNTFDGKTLDTVAIQGFEARPAFYGTLTCPAAAKHLRPRHDRDSPDPQLRRTYRRHPRRTAKEVPTCARVLRRALIDPVCGMMADDVEGAMNAQYQGQSFHICSAGCRRTFERDLERFFIAAGSSQ